MHLAVFYLNRRSNGGVTRREVALEGDRLILGRSAGSHIPLPDLRVGFTEAELREEPEGVMLRGVGDRKFWLAGQQAGAARLEPGMVIGIGPYTLTVIEPPEGGDPDVKLALNIELTTAADGEGDRLLRTARMTLGGAVLNRRRLSWVGFIAAAVLFLILPIVQFMTPGDPTAPKTTRVWPAAFDIAWNSGEISNPHKPLASQCASCHQAAFVMTQDGACLNCHRAIGHHVDVSQIALPELEQERCAHCHKEHQGPRGALAFAKDQEICSNCHVNIRARAPVSSLAAVADFGGSHPQFKVTVVTNAAEKTIARVTLAAAEPPRDLNGLIFPHDKHLNPRGVVSPEGRRQMGCANCHTPEPGGAAILPISMEKHCASCHGLRFEPAQPNRSVPHGSWANALRSVEEAYSTMALRGGSDRADAPPSVRRKPGTELRAEEKLEAVAWAEERTIQAMGYLGSVSVCGACHQIDKTTGSDARGWTIHPVLLQQHYMPKARFTHAKHVDSACGDCHNAAQSSSSADVLMPKIEVCQNCHAGQGAENKVPSTCIDCHKFHREDVGPMRPADGRHPAPTKQSSIPPNDVSRPFLALASSRTTGETQP